MLKPTKRGDGFAPASGARLGRVRPLGYVALKRRAGNGTRTRDINLGKVALYQLSYSRFLGYNINHIAFLIQGS